MGDCSSFCPPVSSSHLLKEGVKYLILAYFFKKQLNSYLPGCLDMFLLSLFYSELPSV